MKVFITGATGYIGTAVGDALRAAGHTISALARSDASREALAARGYGTVAGTMTDFSTLRNAAAAADAIVHTAAQSGPEASAADAAAVTAILAGIAGAPKPFIYTSGVWVYGNTNGRVADETFPLNPARLVAWRPAVEQVVLRAAATGVRTVILRPGIVYGHGAGLISMIASTAEDQGAVTVVGDGTNRWPFVHVDDLGSLYALALSKAAGGSIYNAVHGPGVRVGDIAEALSRAWSVPGRLNRFPVTEARATMGYLADALAMDQQVSAARAREELGWRPHGRPVLDEVEHGSYSPGRR